MVDHHTGRSRMPHFIWAMRKAVDELQCCAARPMTRVSRVASREASGSQTIAVPLKSVARLLSVSSKTDWMPSLAEEAPMSKSKSKSKVASQPTEFLVYQRFSGSVFPHLSDRDLVLKCTWTDGQTVDDKQRATLDICSVEHASRPPVDGVYRASCSKLVWTLTAESAESTLVEVTANMDPGGWTTDLMASRWCASWTQRTLFALEKQCLVEAGAGSKEQRRASAYDFVAASRFSKTK